MKVVLREHVDHLGDRGQIVSVARGYARNYLLPKGLALEATPGNLQMLEHQRRVWVAREAKEAVEARRVAERLSAMQLSITKKAGESGTLYGSVTSSEIAALLASKGVEVDRRRIALVEPIRVLGTHEVPVKLHREVTAHVKLEVVAEEARA